ncbi:MAG: hypothetical protein RLZZ293_1121 [Pseudomonadota bacterium]|jgi:predicted porin
MKKILGVVLGTMSVASFADVTLYGRVSAALENDTFPSANQVQPGTTSVQDYGSYFGIRGTDPVYGQTSVVWQVEQFLNISSGEAYQNTTGAGWVPNHPGSSSNPGQPTTGTNVLASSDSYIGLQGGWGRVRIGNLSNTYRTNTGAVDIFNGANANVMGNYDRFAQILEETIRYDSPTWNDLSFSGFYSFNQDGNFNTGGANGNGMDQSGDMNGNNNAAILGFGLFYTPGNFSVTWNNQVALNTGVYQTMGGTTPGSIGESTVQQGINAYASRLEVGYNDPDSWFLGVGGQISQGYGWFSVPGNGNLNNFWIQNSAANRVNNQYINGANCANGFCPLNQASLSTAEAGISFGWHIENWTPKIGYVYGANMMAGGQPWNIIAGKNQIGGTGYQQAVAELDWNITPRTIAFINYGQIWYGSAAQNTVIQSSATAPDANAITTGGSKWINNGTAAVGFSHTF